MQQQRKTGRLVRWGVPIAVMAVIGGAIGAGPVIAAVSGDPVLPERTAERLLADAASASRKDGPPPMSGTVLQTASLGLPALPELDAASPIALLSGSHEAKVWYGSHDRLRVALPGQMSETNLVVNGGQSWLWESGKNTATRIKTTGAAPGQVTPPPTGSPQEVTPQQAADRLLAITQEHTVIGVTNNTQVAGRAVYQVTLAPKAAGSLVQEVRVALDGETFVPLQVQVYAKGSAEPAFEVGFTQVTFTPPAEENFTFTPPAGAKIVDRTVDLAKAGKNEATGHAAELQGEARTVGEGWTTVAVLPFDKAALKAPAEGGENTAGLLDQLLKAGTPVSGAWGSGTVIRTKLLTALLTDDGRLLAGAVTPEELTKAAGLK
jgi:outer membrane lipoprotein-sorting protein